MQLCHFIAIFVTPSPSPGLIWETIAGFVLNLINADEFHYTCILLCIYKELLVLRRKHLDDNYLTAPNINKFYELMSCTNGTTLKKLSFYYQNIQSDKLVCPPRFYFFSIFIVYLNLLILIYYLSFHL